MNRDNEINTGLNTNREIYRQPTTEGGGAEYYQPYVYVTKDGKIGMCTAGGKCAVREIKDWVDGAWEQSLISQKEKIQ